MIEERHCKFCGKKLIRGGMEMTFSFKRRKTCNVTCGIAWRDSKRKA